MELTCAIVSGKGGVGKTFITAALGVALARLNKNCCVIDADTGLRDLDMVLQMEDTIVYDLVDVINEVCEIKEALLPNPIEKNLSLLPTAQFAKAKAIKKDDMVFTVNQLKKDFETIMIDGPAGVERGFKNILTCAEDIVLITTPDDVAIRNAERVVSILFKRNKQQRPYLIVNRVVPSLVRKGKMYSPEMISEMLEVPLLGSIVEDEKVRQCLLEKKYIMDQKSQARLCIERIAKRMIGEYIPMPDYKKRKLFWKMY